MVSFSTATSVETVEAHIEPSSAILEYCQQRWQWTGHRNLLSVLSSQNIVYSLPGTRTVWRSVDEDLRIDVSRAPHNRG